MSDELDNLIQGSLKELTAAVKSGDSSGVKRVLRRLAEYQMETAQADAHRRRLAEIGHDSSRLARYLGELGVHSKDVGLRLGRKLTAEEQDEYDRGACDRRIEARALELESARRGQKSAVLEWMQR